MEQQPATTATTATTATNPTLFVESVPYLSSRAPSEDTAKELLRLSDGSFLSFNVDNTAERWLIDSEHGDGDDDDDDDDDYRGSNKKKSLRLLGTYDIGGRRAGHICAVELDDTTFLTGGSRRITKEWNKTTCECLRSFDLDGPVCSMMRSNDKAFLVLGKGDGVIEIRRPEDDLGIVSRFKLHVQGVYSLCQLTDGSYVSGSDDFIMKRWDSATGTVLKTFSEPYCAMRLIQLNSDTIVSSSWNFTAAVWKVSTGQLLHMILNGSPVLGVVKLTDDKFVTCSTDRRLRVWSGVTGKCIEAISSQIPITVMTRLGDSIVTMGQDGLLEIRKMKYGLISYYLFYRKRLLIDASRTRLLDLCCQVIAMNQELFDVDSLKSSLPEELFETCFKHI